MENEEKESQKIDIFPLFDNFFQAVHRLWFLVLVLIVLCATVLTVYSYRRHAPVYEASVSFTVKVANPLYANISTYNIQTADQMAKTFPYVLTSGALQQRIREHLNISYVPSISASASVGTSILTLTVRDSDPQLAYDVLKAVITYYPEIAEFVVGPTTLVLLNESSVPTEPANRFDPKGPIMAGALIGFVLWMALLVLLALSKRTIHTEKELAQLLSTPCLGQIPAVRATKKAPYPLIFTGSGGHGFSESIRLLRLRVEKAMSDLGSKVLLISSANPSEGKTTVSVNLAIALAKRGHRTLLMDCDLRSPSVAKILNLPASDSLATYLRGQSGVQGVVQPTSVDNLFIVAGNMGGRRLDKHAQERLFRLIQASRNLFDYVLLDTPPSALLSDAAELSDTADCALFVIRQDHASRGDILDGVQQISSGNIPILGCVLNSVRRTLAAGDSYGYGYNYGYGYGYGSGYGYGYGSSKQSDES